MEEHGDASVQGYWASFELGNLVSRRQEGGTDGVHQQDQVGSWQDSLDTLQAAKHHVKMLKGDGGEEICDFQKSEDLVLDRGMPWWRSLNWPLNMV